MKDKIFVSWKWVDEQIEVLATKIPNDKFKSVAGVPRGGLIPAVMLSHKLGIDYIPFNHLQEYSNEVLIVDDISDSGVTLTEIGTKGYHTATLCSRYSTQYTPDYYGEEIDNDRWIVFPWEENDSKTVQGYLDN